MEGPGGELGTAVERIMAKIRVHLKDDEPGHPIHYNRTYEAVLAELQRFRVLAIDEDLKARGIR